MKRPTGLGWQRLRPFGGIGLILVAFVALGWAYGLVIPPFENLDEIEHFGVVRYVADTGRLPVHGTPDAEVYAYRQEASQPPLYYLLSAGLVRLLGLRADDALRFLRFNPYVACGSSALPFDYNRAILYHDPEGEAYPWQGTLLMLHLLRAWSTLLQVATVVGVYAIARFVFPHRPGLPALAAAIVAFNPQFLQVASGVNNDNLVTPLATWGLYLLLRARQEGLTARRAVLIGLVIGLAGLSKLSGWLLLPLFGVVVLALARRRTPSTSGRRSSLVVPSALVVLTALLLSGWWFWRNWQLYRSPTALEPMLALVGRRASPIFPLLETGLVFRSFWGQVACAFYPAPFYAFFALLMGAAVVGLVGCWRERVAVTRQSVPLLVLWGLLVLVGWIRWDMITPAPGGRLLFPALGGVAPLLAWGLHRLWRGLARLGPPLLAGVALVTLVAILRPIYAPPPRYPAAEAPAIPHPLEATFGSAIRLLGYEARVDDGRHRLNLTLYWQTAEHLSEDYGLAIQMVSIRPGDTTLLLNANTWPGRGNYPTSAWEPGLVIVDRYRLPLAWAAHPTQAWRLQVVFYERETGRRLPVQVDGRPVGDALGLETVRVAGRPPDCPDSMALTPAPLFGEAVALTHGAVEPSDGGLTVLLCWQSRRPLADDYTVFVHVHDGQGDLVGTGDGPPMAGAFPTSLWQPGDVVRDEHPVVLPAGVDPAQIRVTVGLYKLMGGERLPVQVGAEHRPDGEVEVWTGQ